MGEYRDEQRAMRPPAYRTYNITLPVGAISLGASHNADTTEHAKSARCAYRLIAPTKPLYRSRDKHRRIAEIDTTKHSQNA